MEILPVRHRLHTVPILLSFLSTLNLAHLPRVRYFSRLSSRWTMNLEQTHYLAQVSLCWIVNLNSTTRWQRYQRNNDCRWLLLVEENGQNPQKLRLCFQVILSVATVTPEGKLIGVCTLLTSTQNFGAQSVFWVVSATETDCPFSSGVARIWILVAISVAVGEMNVGVVEQNDEQSGSPISDMVWGWDSFFFQSTHITS